jgi:hypothetical protein
VLPVEITHEAPRIAVYDEKTSTEALQDDVDALNEARDVVLARSTQYQQSLTSSPPLFRSGRSRVTTQAGRPWKVRIAMVGTLHSHRSHTGRSVSATR